MDTDDLNTNEHIHSAEGRKMPPAPDTDTVHASPHTGKKRKKSRFLKKAGIFLLVLILIIVLPLVGLIGYSLINRTNPARHIADGYYAAVTIRSASDTLQKGLYLSAVDSLLSSPETAALQGNLRALRSNTALQSAGSSGC